MTLTEENNIILNNLMRFIQPKEIKMIASSNKYIKLFCSFYFTNKIEKHYPSFDHKSYQDKIVLYYKLEWYKTRTIQLINQNDFYMIYWFIINRHKYNYKIDQTFEEILDSHILMFSSDKALKFITYLYDNKYINKGTYNFNRLITYYTNTGYIDVVSKIKRLINSQI